MQRARSPSRSRSPAWGKLLAFALFLAAIAAAWRYTSLSEVVTADNAVAWAHRLRQTPGAPVLMILSYTVAALIMFPRPLLTLTAIVAFGVRWGVLYCAAGIMVAAFAFFCAGRYVPERWLRRLAGDKLEGVQALLREHGIMAIFALNMVPAPPFSVQGLIAGASAVPVLHYALGNLLGLLPTVIGWGFFGHQLAASLEDPKSVSVWAIAAVALVLVAVTLAVRHWVARQSNQDSFRY